METKIRIKRNPSGEGIETIEVLNLAILVKKYDRNWVARVPQLKTFGYSTKGEEDAIEDLYSALDVFFKIHKQKGTLINALSNLGWRVAPNGKRQQNFVPSYLIQQSQSQSHRLTYA